MQSKQYLSIKQLLLHKTLIFKTIVGRKSAVQKDKFKAVSRPLLWRTGSIIEHDSHIFINVDNTDV